MTGDVVLLHGLARTSRVMAKMAQRLQTLGYHVANLDYPSRKYSIENLTGQIAERIAQFRQNRECPLHFIGFSLGSIIAHFYIKNYLPMNLGRVVALGPPYHGSAIIDFLGGYAWFRKFYGPAALELSAGPTGIFRRLGRVDYELGVIAGNKWIFFDYYFAKYTLAQPNDGKVSVASTKIEGCRDHIELPVNHVFMPEFDMVIQQTTYFLTQGYFNK